jgi:hypothetical protein
MLDALKSIANEEGEPGVQCDIDFTFLCNGGGCLRVFRKEALWTRNFPDVTGAVSAGCRSAQVPIDVQVLIKLYWTIRAAV